MNMQISDALMKLNDNKARLILNELKHELISNGAAEITPVQEITIKNVINRALFSGALSLQKIYILEGIIK